VNSGGSVGTGPGPGAGRVSVSDSVLKFQSGLSFRPKFRLNSEEFRCRAKTCRAVVVQF
jgi:hypothetical protein